jgi:hypothetical protein
MYKKEGKVVWVNKDSKTFIREFNLPGIVEIEAIIILIYLDVS